MVVTLSVLGFGRAHRLTAGDVPPNPGGEPLRSLRIAPPVQLELVVQPQAPGSPDVWDGLSGPAQRRVIALLGRMIARGVVVGDDRLGKEEGL